MLSARMIAMPSSTPMPASSRRVPSCELFLTFCWCAVRRSSASNASATSSRSAGMSGSRSPPSGSSALAVARAQARPAVEFCRY
jgi:hypothetical protein